MNTTEAAESQFPFTPDQLSKLIDSLDSLFLGETVTLLPEGCRVFLEYQEFSDEDNTEGAKHLSIRNPKKSDFRIYDQRDMIHYNLSWDEKYILEMMSAVISKYCEIAIVKLSTNAFEETQREPWLEKLAQSQKVGASYGCYNYNIYEMLSNAPDIDEKEASEYAGACDRLPEFKVVAYPGESLLSMLARGVPIDGTEERKVQSTQRNTPTELELLENWADLSVGLVANDSVIIKIGSGQSREYPHGELGFADMRKGLRLPNNRWKLLVLFAENNGRLKVGEHAALRFSNRARTEKSISNLQKDLRELFDIEEKAIVGNKIQGTFEYRCAFTIQDQRRQHG
jgi:hypothetical protein